MRKPRKRSHVFRFILSRANSGNQTKFFVPLPRKDYKGMGRIRKKQIQQYRYIQMFSKNPHAYRAHAHTVPVKDLPFYLYHLYLYGQWTVWTVVFLKASRVLRARVYAVRVISFVILLSITVHCPKSDTDGWWWVEDVSQNIHAYRVRAVRVIVFKYILHPHPPNPCTVTPVTPVFILLSFFYYSFRLSSFVCES